MMTNDKYDRSILLNCPTCGGAEFEYETESDDNEFLPIKCLSCGLTTTKSDLIDANGENIDANIEDIKERFLKEAKQSLSNAFKGNKFLKLNCIMANKYQAQIDAFMAEIGSKNPNEPEFLNVCSKPKNFKTERFTVG